MLTWLARLLRIDTNAGQGAIDDTPVAGDTVVADSWNIACHLEAAYPNAPALFGGAQGKAHALIIKFGVFQWARAMSPIVLLEPNDPVYAWRTRLLNAFNGYAASAPGEPV